MTITGSYGAPTWHPDGWVKALARLEPTPIHDRLVAELARRRRRGPDGRFLAHA